MNGLVGVRLGLNGLVGVRLGLNGLVGALFGVGKWCWVRAVKVLS